MRLLRRVILSDLLLVSEVLYDPRGHSWQEVKLAIGVVVFAALDIYTVLRFA